MSGTIIGVDEVGMGCWAGPVVVCAFAAPNESWDMDFLNDSKKLSKKQRPIIAKRLMQEMSGLYEIVWGHVADIDQYGIGPTHKKAMELAIDRLIARVGVPHRVIVDGVKQPVLGAECYPKADGKFPCVMAASVIAKVTRDDFMLQRAAEFPQYGFDRHVGYGTDVHFQALQQHGLCELHRRSYKPMNSIAALTSRA